MRLAFWNIKGNAGAPALIATEPSPPDIIALAECPSALEVEASLTSIDAAWRMLPATGHRITVFHRCAIGSPLLVEALETGVIFELRPDHTPPVLVVAVHLKSQLHTSVLRLGTRLGKLRKAILQAETRVDHRSTVVIGDLNLDPFAHGLNDREILIATMDHRQAIRLAGRASMQDATFYNPMWSRMGDASPGPPGTWHTSSDSDGEYFFHTFDQVLLRPDLIARFGGVDVPRTLGLTPLVTENDIPKRGISDHLPVICDLD